MNYQFLGLVLFGLGIVLCLLANGYHFGFQKEWAWPAASIVFLCHGILVILLVGIVPDRQLRTSLIVSDAIVLIAAKLALAIILYKRWRSGGRVK